MEKQRKRRKRDRVTVRVIAGEKYVCTELAAEYIGCSRSTLDKLMALSKTGSLKPSLVWHRDTPKSPIWFSLEFLKEWSLARGRMHQ